MQGRAAHSVNTVRLKKNLCPVENKTNRRLTVTWCLLASLTHGFSLDIE